MDKKQTLAFHGLNTGYDKLAGDNFGNCVKKVDAIIANPNWEVCTSDCPIGEIGIVIRGELVFAHHDDAFSHFNKAGKRQCQSGRTSNPNLSAYSQAALRMYAAKAEINRKNGKFGLYEYCEFWHTECQVVAVWVSRKGQPNTLATAKSLAEWYGLPVMVVDENISQLDKLVGI